MHKLCYVDDLVQKWEFVKLNSVHSCK